ncbi:MAG: hypothetical protein AB7F43_07530 [Bacteriovoracia bacterium]
MAYARFFSILFITLVGLQHIGICADEDLRELERAFIESQDTEAKVAWFSARARAGEPYVLLVSDWATLGDDDSRKPFDLDLIISSAQPIAIEEIDSKAKGIIITDTPKFYELILYNTGPNPSPLAIAFVNHFLDRRADFDIDRFIGKLFTSDKRLAAVTVVLSGIINLLFMPSNGTQPATLFCMLTPHPLSLLHTAGATFHSGVPSTLEQETLYFLNDELQTRLIERPALLAALEEPPEEVPIPIIYPESRTVESTEELSRFIEESVNTWNPSNPESRRFLDALSDESYDFYLSFIPMAFQARLPLRQKQADGRCRERLLPESSQTNP